MKRLAGLFLLAAMFVLSGCQESVDGTYQADFSTADEALGDIAAFAQMRARLTITGSSTLLEVKALGAEDRVQGKLCRQAGQLRVSAKQDPCQKAELVFEAQENGDLYCVSCAETAFAPIWRRVDP